MKIIVDMNLSPDWVELLHSGGHDAAHWSQLGVNNAPDSEIMKYAESNGWVILSADLGFGTTLVMSKAYKPSVVQLRTDELDPLIVGQQVLAALTAFESQHIQTALITIDENRTRTRVLPFPVQG